VSGEARWLNAEAAAAYISVSVASLRRHVSRGRIPPPEKRGKGWRWNSAAIDAAFGQSSASKPIRPTREAVPFDGTLLSATEIQRQAKPFEPRTGIYFLLLDGEIVYVGQSIDVFARLAQHIKEKTFDRWHWVPCPANQILSAERAYIRAFKPPLNKVLLN
jgi:predicted DNA-binding transcriptional regulator AlpA